MTLSLDMAALTRLLGAELAQVLRDLPMQTHVSLAELEKLLDDASENSATVEEVGRSSAGRSIRMATFVSPARSAPRVMLYAFPHPDEPMGACLVAAVLRALMDEKLGPALLRVASWSLLGCADPDLALYNERWMQHESLNDLLTGTLRPEHTEREADYGFAVGSQDRPAGPNGLFWQPSWYEGGRMCNSAGKCVQPTVCGPVCQAQREPLGPLPESRALANAFELARPDLVVSLHDTHTGGAYTFIKHQPSTYLQTLLTSLAPACGVPRHLGRLPDPGRRWKRSYPDLIREPDLARRAQRFLRATKADPLKGPYLGNVSAAQHLEWVDPSIDYMVPEAPHLTDPAFGDTSLSPLVWDVEVVERPTRRGARHVVITHMPVLDGTDQELLLRMRKPGDEVLSLGLHPRTPVTSGFLGVLAMQRRREAFMICDRVWAKVPARYQYSSDPFAIDRRNINVPGRYIGDGSMRLYRLARSYEKQASVAEAADYLWRHDIHTAQRVGMLLGFLRRHDIMPSEQQELLDLMEQLTRHLPPSLRFAYGRVAGARSQLARVFAWLIDRQQAAPN